MNHQNDGEFKLNVRIRKKNFTMKVMNLWTCMGNMNWIVAIGWVPLEWQWWWRLFMNREEDKWSQILWKHPRKHEYWSIDNEEKYVCKWEDDSSRVIDFITIQRILIPIHVTIDFIENKFNCVAHLIRIGSTLKTISGWSKVLIDRWRKLWWN